MKTLVKVNVATEEITMSKATARKAAAVGSKEYDQLARAKKDFPNFRVKILSPKPKESSNKGLTVDVMREIIMLNGRDSTKIIDEFDRIRKGTKGTSHRFSAPKAFFLSTYPNWREFLEEAEERLEERKKQTQQTAPEQQEKPTEAAQAEAEMQAQAEGAGKLFGVFRR